MPDPDPVPSIAGTIARSLSIKHVYGDPVIQGDTTVIPVARVAYVFGGGGGGGRANRRAPADDGEKAGPDAFGSGGGGACRMTPVGVLEIGPGGSRFVRYRPVAPLVTAAALGLAAGWLLGRFFR